MRTWVLLACLSFGLAACDDGDDLEKKTDASASTDTRTADTAPSTDTGGADVRDGGTDVRDGATDGAAATDGVLADRILTDVPGAEPARDTTTTDATIETGGEGGNSVDAADTAGQ